MIVGLAKRVNVSVVNAQHFRSRMLANMLYVLDRGFGDTLFPLRQINFYYLLSIL